MKLNKQGRDEVRKSIEIALKEIPQGQRIHLDKLLLENLLFETITYDKDKKKTLRLPYWSGEFLEKIDLCEINFENVAWSLIGEDFSQTSLFHLDEDSREKITSKNFGMPKEVNYQNTNASIDFSTSWECNITKYPHIQNCNFSGMDLSKTSIILFKKIENCNLSNTHIKIPAIDKLTTESIIDTNLDNLNFWNCTINAYKLASGKTAFIDCSFVNTGLNVKYESIDFKEDKTALQNFSKMIKNKKLDGCSINGKILHTIEERQELAQKKLREYERMKENLIESITQSIKEQTKKIIKKRNNN